LLHEWFAPGKALYISAREYPDLPELKLMIAIRHDTFLRFASYAAHAVLRLIFGQRRNVIKNETTAHRVPAKGGQ
jgi:hypothetical protein